MAKVRTQVYLEKEQEAELKLLANTSGKKFSELIREGVEKLLADKKRKKKKSDPWKNFIGKGKGGPKNLSSKIDYYLYEEPYSNKK